MTGSRRRRPRSTRRYSLSLTVGLEDQGKGLGELGDPVPGNGSDS